jgi:hypothetical protein
MTVVLTGAEGLPWGVARLIAGIVFSLGLILVIVGGAELFTGDSLMIVAYASRRITLAALLRAWSLVYVGNIVGAVGTAALVFLAGHYGFAGGALGKTALAVAAAKAALPTVQLFRLGVPVQCPGLSSRVDVVRRPDDDRQGDGHRPADCGLRRRRPFCCNASPRFCGAFPPMLHRAPYGGRRSSGPLPLAC